MSKSVSSPATGIDAQRREVSAEDRITMGSPGDARLALIEKARAWRQLRQPVMGNRAALNDIDAKEREARFDLANAASLWLWHEENPAPGLAQQHDERARLVYRASGMIDAAQNISARADRCSNKSARPILNRAADDIRNMAVAERKGADALCASNPVTSTDKV